MRCSAALLCFLLASPSLADTPKPPPGTVAKPTRALKPPKRKTVAEWTRILCSSPNANLRYRATWVLALSRGKATSALPALLAALDDREALVSSGAAYALARIDAQGTQILEPLRVAIADPRCSYRAAAIEAVKHLGPSAQRVVPELLRGLSAKDKVVRFRVAEALGSVGRRPGTPVVAGLVKLLEARGPFRADALSALIDIAANPLRSSVKGSSEPHLVPELRLAAPILAVYVRTDADMQLRHQAAVALGCLRSLAKSAAPALRETIRLEKQPAVRLAALRALMRIDLSAAAIPALVAAVQDRRRKHMLVRSCAVMALMKLGPAAAPAAKALIAELDRDTWDSGLQTSLCLALGAIGPRAKAAVPALERLRDTGANKYLRAAAAGALAQINRKAKGRR